MKVEDKMVNTSVRIPRKLFTLAKVTAAQTGTTMQALIRDGLALILKPQLEQEERWKKAEGG